MEKKLFICNKKVAIALFAGIVLSFFLGWTFAFNFGGSYETGYKMAYLEMQQLLKEGAKGKTDFFIQGLEDFKFYPRNSDTIAISLENNS